MNLKIEVARLPDRPGIWDIAIRNGTITEIAPKIASFADETLAAVGKLVIPGLVDPHFHLDKALLLERSPACEGTFSEAMRETLRLKRSFTATDIQTRARRIIEQAISCGTTAMRSHVEVDPTIGLTAMEALIPLQSEYAWGMTLQLAVFAQEGITNQPGIEVGKAADLVILDATSVTEAIATAPVERLVIRRGRVVAASKVERQFLI